MHKHVVRNMRNELKIIILLLLSFVFMDANATGQYPDKIIIDGKEYSIRNNPLEPYFEKYPDRKPKTTIMSSALHRGYIATFTLIDKKIYLTDIKIKAKKKDSDKRWETEMKSVFNEVFPNDDKILMDLYSEILIVHLNLEVTNKERNRLLIEFQNGTEQERRTYDNEKYKVFMDEQFELYKKTEKYKSEFLDLMKDDEDDDDEYYENKKEKEQFIENLIRTYTPNFTSKFTD
jgi:translation elongation factor EF-G